MDKPAIILLAAGPSSRLGKPKQLLIHHGKTMIENIISEAHEAGLQPVVVVTGAVSEVLSKLLENTNVEIVFNDQWPSGMASGIVAGLSRILAMNPKTEAAIIAVCDQPFVSAELFTQLIKIKAEKSRGIIGCAYAGTVGTPVLFEKRYFKRLLLLKGNEGAKKLLMTYGSDLVSVPFDQGSIDIDTREDYDQLLLRTR